MEFLIIILILISIISMITIPLDTFQEWNNPTSWISYPKVAVPIWMNLFMVNKIPEHMILDWIHFKNQVFKLAHKEKFFLHQINLMLILIITTFQMISSMNFHQNIQGHPYYKCR